MPRKSTSSTPKTARAKSRPATDLREACIAAAHSVIAEHGIEKLSLRDVARKLGVSHQAPYKHYASRDHLLAAVIARCFEQFAQYLLARSTRLKPADELEEMAAMGRAYLRYAQEHPLEYRLMFGTPWPDTAAHPAIEQHARVAFDVLLDALTRKHGPDVPRAQIESEALFVWSTLHGLSSITQSHAMDRIGIQARVIRDAPTHTLQCIGRALAAVSPAQTKRHKTLR